MVVDPALEDAALVIGLIGLKLPGVEGTPSMANDLSKRALEVKTKKENKTTKQQKSKRRDDFWRRSLLSNLDDPSL